MAKKVRNVAIPVALQIIADDYGWHNGRDGRLENRPSRSGQVRCLGTVPRAVIPSRGPDLH